MGEARRRRQTGTSELVGRRERHLFAKRSKKFKDIPAVYRPKASWFILSVLLFSSFAAAIGWLFFEHWAASAALSFYGYRAGRQQLERHVRKMKQQVSVQFEQMLFAIATSLQAGKSVENAFKAAEADLRQLYSGIAPIVLKELESVNRKVDNGTPIEKAIADFQKTLSVDEIAGWADMLTTCKRTGGDLVKVMRQTSRLVVEKMNMERELTVLISGKKFEARLLSIVPFVIIGVFRYGSPEYMEPLYNGAGRIAMAVALLLLWAGMIAAQHLMKIEV